MTSVIQDRVKKTAKYKEFRGGVWGAQLKMESTLLLLVSYFSLVNCICRLKAFL